MKTWQHDETGRMTDSPECPGPRWSEVPNYAPPLDDEGRLMVGAHHYTDENIRTRIEQLRRYASGSAESTVEFINLDWRGFCNTTAHIMSALYAGLEPAQTNAYAEGRKDEADENGAASRLIDAWVSAHGKTIPWDKAVEIVAIVNKLTDAERQRLLSLS